MTANGFLIWDSQIRLCVRVHHPTPTSTLPCKQIFSSLRLSGFSALFHRALLIFFFWICMYSPSVLNPCVCVCVIYSNHFPSPISHPSRFFLKKQVGNSWKQVENNRKKSIKNTWKETTTKHLRARSYTPSRSHITSLASSLPRPFRLLIRLHRLSYTGGYLRA